MKTVEMAALAERLEAAIESGPVGQVCLCRGIGLAAGIVGEVEQSVTRGTIFSIVELACD